MGIKFILLAIVWGFVVIYYFLFIKKHNPSVRINKETENTRESEIQSYSLPFSFNQKEEISVSRYFANYSISDLKDHIQSLVNNEEKRNELSNEEDYNGFESLTAIYSENSLSNLTNNDIEISKGIEMLKAKHIEEEQDDDTGGGDGDVLANGSLFEKLDNLDSYVSDGLIKKKTIRKKKVKALKQSSNNLDQLYFDEIQNQMEKEYEEFLKNSEK